MLCYQALQIACLQNDSSILLIFVAAVLWEKQLWGTENGKEGKVSGFLWNEPKVTPPHQRRDAGLAFLPLPGIQRDPLLKGSKAHFNWSSQSKQESAHPNAVWGSLLNTFLRIRVYDQEKMTNYADEMMLPTGTEGLAEKRNILRKPSL